MDHLRALGLANLKVTPDPVRVASEAALWGAIEAEGLLGGAVVVSDDAGQFRIGDHALCWVHAERLIHKLVPANDRQRNAIEVARRMVWWFYRQLKDYKLAPSPQRAAELSARFDRIFKRRTGYALLDRLLKRLLGRKDELLRVLERPDIPLNTNASENDIRAFVTKRKVSGGPSAKKVVRRATQCSASPKPARNSKSPSSTISTPASAFLAPPSRISQPSSAPHQAKAPARNLPRLQEVFTTGGTGLRRLFRRFLGAAVVARLELELLDQELKFLAPAGCSGSAVAPVHRLSADEHRSSGRRRISPELAPRGQSWCQACPCEGEGHAGGAQPTPCRPNRPETQ